MYVFRVTLGYSLEEQCRIAFSILMIVLEGEMSICRMASYGPVRGGQEKGIKGLWSCVKDVEDCADWFFSFS